MPPDIMDNIDEQFEDALHREACARTEHLQLPAPDELAPDAPAPRLQQLMRDCGPGPCARALAAWQARMNGDSILQVACDMGLSIPAAKALLREVYEAISEDLKENVDFNRQLDLARIDTLIAAHLPKAQSGKVKSAQLVLRALERRSKLIGLEPLPAPTHSSSQSVLIWIQSQMPSINKLVDSLPPELPPTAPGS
jgi:hypothetical protein